MIARTQTDTAQNPILQSRVLLGQGIEDGFEPPEELEAGILLRGRVHHLFSEAGTGKSFVALWLVVEALERGQRVLYADMENGPHIVSERLNALGVGADTVDDLLTYLSSPSLSLNGDDRSTWPDLLDKLNPDLVVFDSWVGFLGAAGLEENSNDDVTKWSVAYSHPARAQGITVLILDHVPHDAKRSRGASRKKDEADVQFQLLNTQPFDRETVGEVVLVRKKDREGWLPPSVTLSIGGTEDGFVCRRSQGTFEKAAGDGLTPSARKTLRALVSTFGSEGATFTQWWKAADQAKSTFGLAKQHLETAGFIRKDDDGLYFATLNPGSSPTGPLDNDLDRPGPEEESSPVQQLLGVGLDGPPVGPVGEAA